MLRSAREMYGSSFASKGKAMGKLNDLGFDDRTWQICYFVVNIPGRRIFLPLASIEEIRMHHGVVNVTLTEEIKGLSPHVGEPDSREMPDPLAGLQCRSPWLLIGMNVEAEDDILGNIDDILLNDTSWHIDYLVINTHQWLPGKKLLVTPHDIDAVDWEGASVKIDYHRKLVVMKSQKYVFKESQSVHGVPGQGAELEV